ncbi:MAG: TolC family protein [Deltaproteobacteria bacterium]|nr:TolC family protein [Deltaproteobacteria bacterium]
MSERRRFWTFLSMVFLATVHAGLILEATTSRALAADARSGRLSPADVVKTLASRNPTLRASLAEAEAARQAVDGERSRYVPQFSLDGGYTTAGNPSLTQSGVVVGRLDSMVLKAGVSNQFVFGTSVQTSVSLSRTVQEYAAPNLAEAVALGPGYGLEARLALAQPLLRGFGRSVGEASLRTARAALTQAEAAEQRTASDLVRQALTAYWELWYAEAAVRIREAARALVERELADAELRLKAGAISALDVLSLRTELASADEALIQAHDTRRTQWVTLLQLMGVEAPARGPSWPATTDQPPTEAAGTEASGTAEIDHAEIERAYEIQGLRAERQRAEVSVVTAQDDVRPALNLEGWVSVQGLGNREVPAAFRQVGRFDAVSAYVGLHGELEFDRTRRRAEEARAMLGVTQVEARLREAEVRIGAQMATLRRQMSSTRRRFALVKATIGLAREMVEGQKARFDQGAGTTLELLVAQQQLREAELRDARTQVDFMSFRLQLRHLEARLLDDVAESR